MGIYTSGKIYGIRIYNHNDDGDSNILYEKKYDVIMDNDALQEAKIFYEGICEKEEIKFQIYTECFTTHDADDSTQMIWYTIDATLFLQSCNA